MIDVLIALTLTALAFAVAALGLPGPSFGVFWSTLTAAFFISVVVEIAIRFRIGGQTDETVPAKQPGTSDDNSEQNSTTGGQSPNVTGDHNTINYGHAGPSAEPARPLLLIRVAQGRVRDSYHQYQDRQAFDRDSLRSSATPMRSR